jgi:uncharacterized protein YndB with AHSA1/START domain
MEEKENAAITVKTTVSAPMNEVWKIWTSPEHIVKWNNASDDWHTPAAENDLKVGGKFVYRMEAKDGSFGFAFSGIYEEVLENSKIAYVLEDQRKVIISFEETEQGVLVTEMFDPEQENSIELQKNGWQAILDNFKKYAESLAKQ